MLTFLRTNSTHQDFISLVRHLDIELATIDGDEHKENGIIIDDSDEGKKRFKIENEK